VSDLSNIRRLLQERARFEVVEVTPSETQFRVIGRVPPNAGSHWVVVVHHLLKHTKSTVWKVDISRQYFLRDTGAGEKLFYAWRLIFQGGPKILMHVPDIVKALESAPPPSRVELQGATEIKWGEDNPPQSGYPHPT